MRWTIFLIAVGIAIISINYSSSMAATLVSENFDSHSYTSALQYYTSTGGYDPSVKVYDTANAHGGSGYCLKFDHATKSDGSLGPMGSFSAFPTYATSGIYFRYWIKYDSAYLWPKEESSSNLDNVKIFKFAGSVAAHEDIESSYQGSADGSPSSALIYWLKNDGSTSPSYYPSFGTQLTKNVWHKVEIYIQFPNKIHVQLDDNDVLNKTDANFQLPASGYTGTTQFMAIRASNYPPAGHGYFYTDDVSVVAGEGDLCNNEPPTPSGTVTAPSPAPSTDAPPTVSIQQPTNQTSYTTDQSSINLAGTASDANSIQSVTWSNSQGDGGSITSVTGNYANWSISALPLQEGLNQITITATDSAGQATSTSLEVTYNLPGTFSTAWTAASQAGSSTWTDSGATWSIRLLVQGSSLLASGNQVRLGFQGRNSGDYSVKKVSIAQRDTNGNAGDIIDSTWTKVTFDGSSVSNWDTTSTIITPGSSKLSDPISFPLEAGKDYYVTFMLNSPSAYLVSQPGYQELYFDGVDHTDDLDWSSNGYSVYDQRIHALSAILSSGTPLASPAIVNIQ